MRLKRVLLIVTVIALGVFGKATASAHPASGIVLDRAGNIYFSDLETVWKIDRSGKLSVFRPGVSGRHVHELAIDADDNIYGADLSYESQKFISDVWKMTSSGAFQYLLEPTDKPPRGMSIWRDREGNNYLFDQDNQKTHTLLLRRTPDGVVTTLAGGAYGHADGKGAAARFSHVANIAFAADGGLYATDGPTLRKIMMDGTVSTIANHLDARTAEDKPTLFGGTEPILTGLAIDSNHNAYVADSGNRRLLKISGEGKVVVLLRTDPPFTPNGVFLGPGGEVYVLEVGFTPPRTWIGPRVRRISPAGETTILATVGANSNASIPEASAAQEVVVSTVFPPFFPIRERIKYGLILGAGILCTAAIFWQRRRKQRA
jgi:DNA-binding beta-propeller fold protein YncE